MSVIQTNRDILLKDIRVAKVLPTLRKHLPEFLITDVENQLTIRRKNEKLLDILKKREDGDALLKMSLESSYPQLMYMFSKDESSEDENAPPRPPPPRAAPKKSVSRQLSDDLFKGNTRPSDYKANNAKPVESKSPPKTFNTKPIESKPPPKVFNTKPIESKPPPKVFNTKPIESKPPPKVINTKPIESKPPPSVPKVSNVKPVESKPMPSAPKIMPKPKVSVTPRLNQPTNGVSHVHPKKDEEDRLNSLLDENKDLKKQISDQAKALVEMERDKSDNSVARDYARLKTKYDNVEREKDMVVTEKLAMETEQSIILKENEFLKKIKNNAVSKREADQYVEEKEHAELARDEALRESLRLKRELDELQRQYGDVVYAKDVSEDDKRREVRDKARLEKECERLREELQEERKHAQKLSSSSVPLSQLEKLQNELDETRNETRSLARERDTVLQEKNTLLIEKKSSDSNGMRVQNDKIAQLSQEITNLTDDKNNISFENAMVTDQLNAAMAGLEDMKNERKQLSEQNDLMRSDIEHLLKEREDIMEELEQTKQAMSGSSDEKEAIIRGLRQNLTNQQNTTDAFEARCGEAEEATALLREDILALSEREKNLEEERDTYRENYNTVQGQLDQIAQDKNMAKSENDKLFQELDDVRKEMSAALEDKDALASDHQQALDEIEKLHHHIAQLERAPPPTPVVAEVVHAVERGVPPFQRPDERMPVEERVASPPPAPPSFAHEEEDLIEDRDWRSEIKAIILNKSKHNARSFGFTIGGGINNPQDNPEDCHIYVMRVQQGGVADRVLHRDDALLSVNGNDLSKVTHEYAVSTLTSSGDRIELVIRRKFIPELIKIINLSPYLDRGLGFSIIGGKSDDVTQDPGIYIAKVLPGGAAEAEGILAANDRILTINGSYVVNVSRKYAESLLSGVDDQCVLRVAKPFTSLQFTDDDGDGAFSQYGKRGRSTEDLRRPMSPDLFGVPANFKDTRGMNRAGSTPLLHDERLYQNNAPAPLDPLKRSSSQGYIRTRDDMPQGRDLQRSRSQDWAPPHMMDPRNVAPSYAMRRINVTRPNLQTSLGLEVYTATSGQLGIFVNKLDKQGLSFRAGLRCADQILEVNGSNLRNATHDEAVGILSQNVNLNLICQQSPKQFGEMHQSMRTGFFVRALYSYTGGPDSGLTFKEGDVFHIIDRESMEQEGWWLALSLRGATAVQCGEIPSHHRAIQHIQQKFGPPPQDMRGDKKGRKSLLGNVFKKDGRDTMSQTSSVDDQQDINPYEPVVRKDLMFSRPIIILGPLTELLNDRLVNDCPEMFNRCILYTTRQPEKDEVNGRDFWFVSQHQIEEIQAGRDNDKFVECRHISGHTYYYSGNAIKEVAKQHKHCVLNVGIHSIDRLQSVDLHPIVVFVKFKSAQDIRQQFNDRCSIEQAQKVFEKAVKLERGFSDKFSATFSGSSMEEVFVRIKEYIRDNTSNVMWVKQN